MHSPSFARIFCHAASAGALLASLLVAQPVLAQTLDFDDLPAEPGPSGGSLLVSANSGDRDVSGIVFNRSARADWEIYGNAFAAPYSGDTFADSHSGEYALAGNAYAGQDIYGRTYTGLTISTSLSLTSLYVGFDDNGDGSNDADALTITAFGVAGDLASATVALSAKALSLFDTSGSFSHLAGVTGYRFETEPADRLDQAYGRAFVIADDMSFAAAVPEPSQWLALMAGIGVLWLARPKPPRRTAVPSSE